MPLRPIGFIGGGIMGLPMIRHLCGAGYPVKVYNRTPSKVAQAKAWGATVVGTPREAAADVQTLITMVTNPEAVRSTMEGPSGFLSALSPEMTWIQMSTLDIQSTLALSVKASAKGCHFVDSPVTGSKKQVEAAELILLIGARVENFQKVRPLLSRLGKTIVHAGDVGAGTALKLCMNLIVAQMTTALAESVRLAETTGLNPKHVFDVLRASPALDCGYFRIKEEALLKHEFPPAFSLANMLKDVGFILKEAAARKLSLPVTEAVEDLLEKASKQGHGEDDLTVIYKALLPPSK